MSLPPSPRRSLFKRLYEDECLHTPVKVRSTAQSPNSIIFPNLSKPQHKKLQPTCSILKRSASTSSTNNESSPLASRRHQSEPTIKCTSFDPNICVREFTRSPVEKQTLWYTPSDLAYFRHMAFAQPVLLPTPQGAISTMMISLNHRLPQDDVLQQILIVDPRKVCRDLFSRAFCRKLPTARVHAVATAEEAAAARELQNVEWDLILCEFDLRDSRPTSGTEMMTQFQESHPQALLIGVSTTRKQESSSSCCDVVWSKPPPRMDDRLMEELTRLLQDKRKDNAAIQ